MTTKNARIAVYVSKSRHIELLRSVATQLGTTSLKDGLEYVLNCYLTGNAPIEQSPIKDYQLPVKTKDVAASSKEKVARRFGTPKDRQSIENLKRIFLLDQMGFYEPCWSYFEPTSQSVILYSPNDDGKDNSDYDNPESLPPVAMLWDLWEIPGDHPSFGDLACIRWGWEVADRDLDEQLKESLECLKSLDEILIRNGKTVWEEVAWEKRICGFFRGDFEKVLTSTQESLILEFVESCMARVSEELDEFYVPFVEIQV